MASSLDPHAGQPILHRGPAIADARLAAVLIHGRGASAEDILSLAEELSADDVAYLAPQAAGHTWYPYSFLVPMAQNEPGLSSALGVIATILASLEDQGIPANRVVLIGFSQGACLASEFGARHARRYAGIAALSGGLIGPPGTARDYAGTFDGTPVFMGCSDVDPHIPLERVRESADVFRRMGAAVDERIYRGMGHTVSRDELDAVNEILSPAGRVMAGRVLIADDQPDVLEALRLLLSQYDFTVRLVTSPKALLEQVNAETWDIVLMDLNYSRDTTSGAEGLQALAEVRAADPVLPIVVMTGWGNVELAVEAMHGGAHSFIQKPWDNAALVQILQREADAGRIARQRGEQHARVLREGLTIQRALMPATLPDTTLVQVAGTWQPADGFGGDCYDAFTFGPATLGLSIADIAGKGLPAALLMSSLQAAVRAFALEGTAPDKLCASVNRLLCGQMIAGRFATLCYLRIDGERGTITYTNAGHNPPLLARANGDIALLQAGGMVLGVFPEAAYVSGEVRIASGDRLLMYTDGITEVRDGNDEEFGEERLADALKRSRRLDAPGLHAAVLAEVNAFATRGFQDDATLLAVAIK